MIDEFLGLAYYQEKGLPIVIFRLFNTVGPRQTGQYGMVIPRFVNQALNNEPISVYGDGKQQRSFTWVGDVVDALISLSGNSGAIGQVFNIGHLKEISIYELAVLVKELCKSSSEIDFISYEDAYADAGNFEDMQRRLPDISKLNELIGYQPTLDLKEILKRIIDYHNPN